MKIDVSSIVGDKAASVDFDFQVERLPLVFPFAVSGFAEPIRVSGDVTNTGKYLLVQGRIETGLEVQCDRCLRTFEYPVDLEFSAEYKKRSGQDDPLRLFDDEDQVYGYEGTTLDLTQVVEDELAVGMPIKMLCDEECKGLCPRCGHNRNESECDCRDEEVDPRLEALRSLLASKD
ncbi:MAG: DUF177 domain-containing protein [Firmicutes bacterium]|nr:DUF177 domain-containing protein [Bacillota bacterium]